MSLDQGFQCLPRSLVEICYPDVALEKGLSLQEVSGVGQKSTMEKCQPDRIGFDQGLTDPRADRTTAQRVIVNYAVLPQHNGHSWRYFGKDIMDFQKDTELFLVQEPVLSLDLPNGYHRELIISQMCTISSHY